jgi:hypothetical protein
MLSACMITPRMRSLVTVISTSACMWPRSPRMFDRGPADVAVKCLQLLMQIGQNGCSKNMDSSQQVVRRDHLVETKLIKRLSLISVLPPHHPPTLLPLLRQESLLAPLLNSSPASTRNGSRRVKKGRAFLPAPVALPSSDQTSRTATISNVRGSTTTIWSRTRMNS